MYSVDGSMESKTRAAEDAVPFGKCFSEYTLLYLVYESAARSSKSLSSTPTSSLLLSPSTCSRNNPASQCLVLAPTRELARQISGNCQLQCRYVNLARHKANTGLSTPTQGRVQVGHARVLCIALSSDVWIRWLASNPTPTSTTA